MRFCTHMEGSIKAVDCVGDGQQSKAPGNAGVLPTAEPMREILKDKLRRAALRQHRQGNDRYDEEQKVTNASNKLERIDELPEEQVENERQKDQRPHN